MLTWRFIIITIIIITLMVTSHYVNHIISGIKRRCFHLSILFQVIFMSTQKEFYTGQDFRQSTAGSHLFALDR